MHLRYNLRENTKNSLLSLENEVNGMSECKRALYADDKFVCLKNNEELSVFDVLYNGKKGELEIIDENGANIDWFELAIELSRKEAELWIMFTVYYDLRERGRKTEQGPFNNSFTLYIGGKPKMLVFVTEETVSFPSKKVVEWLEASRKMGREAVLAIVDKHGEVSYYSIEKFD